MREPHTSPTGQTSPYITGPFLQNLEVRVVVFSLGNDRLQVLLDPIQHDAGSQLPGSCVPIQQSLEETATHVLLCITGLREAYLEQLYTYGDIAHATDANRLVSVVYFAIVPAGVASMHGASIDKDECLAKWFPVDDLPALVQDHGEILAYALRRLRYKLEYTAVGFQLLPEQFSLSELQKVYEIILGEKLDKRNFRRRILQAGIIEETQHLRAGEGRPARLFHYRPDAVAEVKARRLFP
jgi:8-oxo-dGTP diphosphatase